MATERYQAIQGLIRQRGSKLKTAVDIGKAVGAIINNSKVGTHLSVKITAHGLTWSRREDKIATKQRLDGIYVIPARVSRKDLSAPHVVEADKDLSPVERAFRSIKTAMLSSDCVRFATATTARACACVSVHAQR